MQPFTASSARRTAAGNPNNRPLPKEISRKKPPRPDLELLKRGVMQHLVVSRTEIFRGKRGKAFVIGHVFAGLVMLVLPWQWLPWAMPLKFMSLLVLAGALLVTLPYNDKWQTALHGRVFLRIVSTLCVLWLVITPSVVGTTLGTLSLISEFSVQITLPLVLAVAIYPHYSFLRGSGGIIVRCAVGLPVAAAVVVSSSLGTSAVNAVVVVMLAVTLQLRSPYELPMLAGVEYETLYLRFVKVASLVALLLTPASEYKQLAIKLSVVTVMALWTLVRLEWISFITDFEYYTFDNLGWTIYTLGPGYVQEFTKVRWSDMSEPQFTGTHFLTGILRIGDGQIVIDSKGAMLNPSVKNLAFAVEAVFIATEYRDYLTRTLWSRDASARRNQIILRVKDGLSSKQILAIMEEPDALLDYEELEANGTLPHVRRNLILDAAFAGRTRDQILLKYPAPEYAEEYDRLVEQGAIGLSAHSGDRGTHVTAPIPRIK